MYREVDECLVGQYWTRSASAPGVNTDLSCLPRGVLTLDLSFINTRLHCNTVRWHTVLYCTSLAFSPHDCLRFYSTKECQRQPKPRLLTWSEFRSFPGIAAREDIVPEISFLFLIGVIFQLCIFLTELNSTANNSRHRPLRRPAVGG